MFEELKKPFRADQIKQRVGSTNYDKTKGLVLNYIDARDVMDRLDEVVGADKWQTRYKDVKGNLFCGIGIKIGDNWIWKYDAGAESNTEKEKGEASDSLKRAGVQWGIGRFLYDIPARWLALDTYKDSRGETKVKGFNEQELKDYQSRLQSYLNKDVKEPEKPVEPEKPKMEGKIITPENVDQVPNRNDVKVSAKQLGLIHVLITQTGDTKERIYKDYGVTSLADLNVMDASALIQELQDKKYEK